MKKIYSLLFTITVLAIVLFYIRDRSQELPPVPTEIAGEEDAENAVKREKWFELMHKAAPGTNWEAIEYTTQKRRSHKRAALRNTIQNRTGSTEIAGGKLVGTWNERGSNNQAGSVFETEFDPETEEIWVLSAGGTIFKGPMTGNNWEVINQDIRFNNGLLKFVPTGAGRRLLALSGKVPQYSDDDGRAWHASTGIPVGDRWMTTQNCVILNNPASTFYAISKPDYWTNAKLYKSIDLGESFTEIMDLQDSDFNNFKLCNPHGTEQLYLIQKINDQTRLSQIDIETDEITQLQLGSQLLFGDAQANLAAIKIGNDLKFIAFAESGNNIYTYQSLNKGATWDRLGLIEDKPWDVGLFISKTDPDLMLTGGIDCFVTKNGGRNWFRKNRWWDYYDNVDGALHADMMAFNEFTTNAGQTFQLISNHGGLSISTDYMSTVKNLSLSSLNVSQYYSVRTDPTDPSFIYAGAQDQGFQRANTGGNDNIADFNQIIGGDYGHIVFSKFGTQLWTVYPGGAVSNFPSPKSSGISNGWTLESDDESVWLPPMMESPDKSENSVYLAGGNAFGGSGSHIIKLTSQFNDIVSEQLSFDFKSESAGGEVSALAFAKSQTNQWYAATTNGRFFSSDDAGQNWEQSLNFIPDGHYLYGQAIEVSKTDPMTVYLGGSGYSGEPCFVSADGGKNFQALADSLPPTLIFDLVLNDDENMLFAATEAGPYVYIFEDKRWYDLSGLDAPAQTYWSVEFVPSSNTVRFGTYGRGIWDFNIESFTDSKNIVNSHREFKVFPNPSSSGKIFVEFTSPLPPNTQFQLTDISGKVIREFNLNTSLKTGELDVSGLTGVYFLNYSGAKDAGSQKVILQ